MNLTWRQVRGARLHNHYLTRAAADPVTAVRAVGGVQAQVLTAAELAVGARLSGGTRARVRAALWQDRSLVKAYGWRGTLHLLAAEDLARCNAAMRARPYWTDSDWCARIGLTPGSADRLFATIAEVLGAEPMTRDELAGEVGARIGAGLGERLTSTWGELLRPAGYLGALCFGPNRGSKVTFVRPRDWLGPQAEIGSREALLDVVRGYFRAYAPATHRELGRWLGYPPPQARRLIDLIADELVPVTVESWQAWAPPDYTPPPAEAAGVRLLGQYEAYVLGCGPTEQVTPPAARARVFAIGRGRYEGAAALNILLVDGLVAGVWQRTERPDSATLRVEWFQEPTAAQADALDKEVCRLGMFLGVPTTLSLERAGDKPHR